MTIHQSKGLEFDFVYLPFAWRMSISSTLYQNKEGLYKINDQQIYFKKSLEDYLSNEEQEKIREYQNQNFYYYFAESLRLFYVALTRAKKEIFIGYGDYQHLCNKQSVAYNPLYYYLHFAKNLKHLETQDTKNIQNNLKQYLKQLTANLHEENILEDLNNSITLSKETISKEEFSEFSLDQLKNIVQSKNKVASPLLSNEKLTPEIPTDLDFLETDFDLEKSPPQLLDLPQKYQFFSFSSLLKITSKKGFAEKNSSPDFNLSFLQEPAELQPQQEEENFVTFIPKESDTVEKTIQTENQHSTEKNIFTFPAGVDAGNCLHNILEETHFQIFVDSLDSSFVQQPALKSFLKKKNPKQNYHRVRKLPTSFGV